MEWVFVLLAAGALVGLALLLWWFFTKRSAELLSSHFEPEAGYCVWCYEQGKWRVIEDRSAPGFVPGPAPTAPGLHEGACVKVTSVRDSRGP